jgi:hypothetical protein
MEEAKKGRFSAGPLTFAVRHELWDGNFEKIASVLPAMKKQALDMWEQGRRLTGHPGLPLEPTPDLGAAD